MPMKIQVKSTYGVAPQRVQCPHNLTGILSRLLPSSSTSSQPSRSLFPAPGSVPPQPSSPPPPEAGLCPRPACPLPPGGGGPWRAQPLAAARARAGAGGADWPGRSAEPGSPASRWGKPSRHPARPELGARIPQVGTRRFGSRGTEPGPGGEREAPGGLGRAFPRGAERRSFCPAPSEQNLGIFSETEPSSSQGARPLPRKDRSSHPPESKIPSFLLQKWALPPGSSSRQKSSPFYPLK